jgi:HAD superfamily hydrolase (TIGR01484 family)
MLRYIALALDYDGTLAKDGVVSETTVAALQRVRDSGRRLVLVSGRELEDLQRVFPRIDLFDMVVVENGGLLYVPSTREEAPLAEPAPEELLGLLRNRNVTPLSAGRVIVSTWEPNETAVLEAIRELGLERQIIFNKGAVMVLPAGVNKGTGLAAALERLRISPLSVAAVGDAENDHAMLSSCGFSAAVANALPAVKERADYMCAGDHGSGIEEVIERLLRDDLASLEPARHAVEVGQSASGEELRFIPARNSVLIAGGSGSGKSTIARGLIERTIDAGYQVCLIDPEGDYEFDRMVRVGDAEHAPAEETVLQLLEDPTQNAIVNLLGIKLEDRPAYFASLMPRIQEVRSRTAHPHLLVVDEVHHMLPQTWEPAGGVLPLEMSGMLMVTVHPEQVSKTVLSSVTQFIGVGDAGGDVVRAFATASEIDLGNVPSPRTREGFALIWQRSTPDAVHHFRAVPPRSEQHRHKRKYAQGELGDHSFYFRGPEGRLNLRAQNLAMFTQIAEGVDAETWSYHLGEGHISDWFRLAIKDPELADVAEAARNSHAPAEESRGRVLEAIRERYTAPAESPPPS